MAHIHRWKHLTGKQWICGDLNCYAKKSGAEIIGKLAQCNQCKSHFIVTETPANKAALNCPECVDGTPELTLEYQKSILKELAVEEHKEWFEAQAKKAQKDQQELRASIEKFQKMHDNLVIREAELEEEKVKLREASRAVQEHLRREQAKLTVSRQHVAKLTRIQRAKWQERYKELELKYVSKRKSKEEKAAESKSSNIKTLEAAIANLLRKESGL